MNLSEKRGTLYLVPTPIGNLLDISRRAVEILGRVSLIAAEDTRETRKLLKELGISNRLISYHDHNERQRAPWLVQQLIAGNDIALVSDAGTPLLADPGYRLISLTIAEKIPISSIPGPSAAITALVASGLATDRFCFAGFLPRKQGQRLNAIREFRDHPSTLILYEAPHRLIAALQDLEEILGDREAVIGWNVTKETERYFRGTLSALTAEFSSWEYVHGEITLIIAGAGINDEREQWSKAEHAIQLLLGAGIENRTILELIVEIFELPKRQVYQRLLAMAQRRYGERQ